MTGLLAQAVVDIQATRDRVWAALTDPALIAQHMWGAVVETDWRVGSPIVWRGEHQGRAYEDKGEVLVYDEPERLSVTHFSPLTGQDDVPENYHTLVYTLTETREGTRVELTQDGCDNHYVIDQVFWQHFGLLWDRLDAQDFAETIYTELAQILHIGEDRAGTLMPWLDELVALSIDGDFVHHFYRMQALWFSIAHVVAPFITTSPFRTSATQRAQVWPTQPRLRRFAPLRTEARKVAELLRTYPERHWSVSDLAAEVHLSKSQVGRVFVDAYGKSPIAYLTMLRAEQMARLLREADTPIAEIAHRVGWSDPDFAARQFRRSVGITPSRYRLMIRERAVGVAG